MRTNVVQQNKIRGTWVAQLVKRPTPDFGSGHNLTVCEFKHHVELCTDSTEPVWNSLPPSLFAPPLLTHYLSLCQNKEINIKKNKNKI